MGINISVLGTGYLGATHAVCMAELGHNVIGMDVDEAKVASLQAGETPFFEPGLAELLRRNLAAGRLRFTSSYEEVAEFAAVHFLCVGTPQRVDGQGADMRHVDAVMDALAPLLTTPAVIFGKSTVPVGTTDRLLRRVRAIAPVGDGVDLAWHPEFLREGFAVHDTLRPDRLVFGIEEGRRGPVMKVARQVYATQIDDSVPLLVTDPATAELVKVAANAFLATKISFINAMAEVCAASSADVTQLADAIGYDERIGHQFLRSGIGFGGGCLPKDIRAFAARSRELGVEGVGAMLDVVDEVNERARGTALALAREERGSLVGARVAVLGASFKPNTDDVRDSPALAVASQFQHAGAKVVVFDPMATENARQALPQVGYASSVEAACLSADMVVVLTEWAEFAKLDPEWLGTVVRSKTVIDGRNCLDPESWREAGWTYRGIGR